VRRDIGGVTLAAAQTQRLPSPTLFNATSPAKEAPVPRSRSVSPSLFRLCAVAILGIVPATGCKGDNTGPPVELTVTRAGTGSGVVRSSPPRIDCGPVCSAHFNRGTTVTLNADAAGGSEFTGWSGACTGTGPCVLTMTTAHQATATFAMTTIGMAVTSP
jgi:hypothetical protein